MGVVCEPLSERLLFVEPPHPRGAVATRRVVCGGTLSSSSERLFVVETAPSRCRDATRRACGGGVHCDNDNPERGDNNQPPPLALLSIFLSARPTSSSYAALSSRPVCTASRHARHVSATARFAIMFAHLRGRLFRILKR